jgi:hypothetical protein
MHKEVQKINLIKNNVIYIYIYIILQTLIRKLLYAESNKYIIYKENNEEYKKLRIKTCLFLTRNQ